MVDLTTVKLRIHTPAKPAWLCASYQTSLLGTIELFRQRDVALEVMPPIRDCAWISHARASINARFMASGATHLLQIDGDIGWEPRDALRLLEHGKDLVAAAQPDRKRGHCIIGRRAPDKEKESRQAEEITFPVENDLIACDRVSAAFIMHSRGCIQQMMGAHPHLHAWRSAPWWLPGTPEAEVYFYAFWEQRVTDGRWDGEDHAFCDRAAEAGVQLYVDPFVTLRHNVEVELVGSLAESSRKRPAVRGMPNADLRESVE